MPAKTIPAQIAAGLPGAAVCLTFTARSIRCCVGSVAPASGVNEQFCEEHYCDEAARAGKFLTNLLTLPKRDVVSAFSSL